MNAPILRFDRYNLPDSQTLHSGPAVWLKITRGRVRQPIRRVSKPVFLIGSAPDCDLVVGDKAFPEAYAYLLVQDGNVTIRRLGDEPELLVNGEVIDTADLAAGDRLAFGPFELAVQIQSLPKTTHELPPDQVSGNCPWLMDLAKI